MPSETSMQGNSSSFWRLPSSTHAILVNESQGFEAAAHAFKSASLVGLDCEWKPRASKKHGGGSPRVAVLQVACRRKEPLEEETVYILDMLALKPPTFAGPLKALLSSPHILKLGYAFKDDLRHLAASFPGQDAKGCFDKVEHFVDVGKLFHRVKGPSDPIFVGTGGLAAIANTVLGAPLDKALQCSNWEQRPLSVEQLAYAAADAYCLLLIYDALMQASLQRLLPGKGRLVRTSSPSKSPSRGLADALDLNPPSEAEAADVSSSQSTCLVSSHRLSPIETATAASIMAAGIGGSLEDVVLALGGFAERLNLNSINHERGSHKAKKRQGTKPKRHPDSSRTDAGRVLDEVDWCGPAPWEAGEAEAPRFLCDVHVEGLARQLRCVGFDTASAPGPKADPRQMVEQAEREGRVLLTKDRNLIRRRLLPSNRVYLVRTLGKQAQLKEVLCTFKLGVRARALLCRCIKCNGEFLPEPLNPKEASAAAPWSQVIPECALRAHTEFWQCSECGHIYWEGTQFQRALLQFEASIGDIMEGTVAKDRYSGSSRDAVAGQSDCLPLHGCKGTGCRGVVDGETQNLCSKDDLPSALTGPQTR